MKAVLAEAVARPTPERLHAAGLLLAEAAVGVNHGLHSRAAPAVLQLLLQEGLVEPRDFKPRVAEAAPTVSPAAEATAGAAAAARETERTEEDGVVGSAALGRAGGAPAAAASADEAAAEGEEAQGQPAASRGISEDDVQARVAAVASICLARLLEHTRRGKSGDMWRLALKEMQDRLDSLAALEAAGAGAANGLPREPGAVYDSVAAAAAMPVARRSAARGLALLGQMVEYGRGARVESYAPLFALAARLAQPKVLGSSSRSEGSPGEEQQNVTRDTSSSQEEAAAAAWGEDESDSEWAPFVHPSLSVQVLRLLVALVRAHAKQAGASTGPEAISAVAPQWAAAFMAAPRDELLPFLAQLIAPPATSELVGCFGPAMLGVLGKSLLSGQQPECTWPLLVDVCAVLRPEAASPAAASSSAAASGALPVIFTASGVGTQLAALVRSTIGTFVEAVSSGTLASEAAEERQQQQVAVAWAALRCLPHAAESRAQEAACCARLAAATAAALEEAPSSSPALEEALLLLHCAAATAQARAAAQQQQQQQADEGGIERVLQATGDGLLLLLAAHPSSFQVVKAAAAVLQLAAARERRAAARAGPTPPSFLSSEQLSELLPLLQPNLSSPSAPLRRETLRLLTCFPQPPLLPPPSADAAAAAQQQQEPPPPCDVLQQLLAVEERQHGADSGRPAGGPLPSRTCPCILSPSHFVLCGWTPRPQWLPIAAPLRLPLKPIICHRPPGVCCCSLPTRPPTAALPPPTAAAVTLARIANYLEYRRLPALLLPAVVHALLGVLHIRCGGHCCVRIVLSVGSLYGEGTIGGAAHHRRAGNSVSDVVCCSCVAGLRCLWAAHLGRDRIIE